MVEGLYSIYLTTFLASDVAVVHRSLAQYPGARPRSHSLLVAWVLAGGYTRDIRKVVQVHLNTFRAAAGCFLGQK